MNPLVLGKYQFPTPFIKTKKFFYSMQTTPLTEKHIALNAKMAEFAGFNMPITYTTIRDEHLCVRDNVGIFDVSHMGEFIVKGKEALDLIQWVTTNNAAKLEIGQAQYSCLPNGTGGIVDDLLVYRLSEDQCSEGEKAYMLVVNASNIQKDLDWISRQNKFDTRILNISDQTGLLAIQGPNATQVLQSLTDVNLEALKFYTFTKDKFAGVDNVIISATGYTGAGGFEIYADNDQIGSIWDAILEVGKSHNIQPIGLGARDTLRLEMGYCLYGNDIDDTTSPIEAGLGWITKLKKGAFIDSDTFKSQKENGVQRKLVGFLVEGKRVPRAQYPIKDEEGNQIGKVTSGTLSPSLNQPIGMGYVDINFAKAGTEIFIELGKKSVKGVVTKPPFIGK